MTGKTSTFVIHHDRCFPDRWTASTLIQFAKFIETGDMRYAAGLSMLGLQLVASEHHVPKGGTMQEVGYVKPTWAACEATDDLSEVRDGSDDVFRMRRVYVGPEEFVVPIPIGGADGYVEDWEYKHFDNPGEAEKYRKEIWDDTRIQAAEAGAA